MPVLAVALVLALSLVASLASAMEWTMEDALRAWEPMTRPVQHVGVPGCQWQVGVYWDGAQIYGQTLLRGELYHHPRMAEEVALAGLGANLLHLSVAHGDPMRFADRIGRNSPRIRRSLEEGRLPIPRIQTRDGDLVFSETVCAYLLGREMEDGMTPHPGDVLVVQTVFKVRNDGYASRSAHMWLHMGDVSRTRGITRQLPELAPSLHHEYTEPFGTMGGQVRYVLPRPSSGALVWHDSLPPPEGMTEAPERVIEWRTPLRPGEEAALVLFVPYGLVGRQTAERIARLDPEREISRVRAFWRKAVGGPGTIVTPDPFINDYLAAVAGQMAQQVCLRHGAGLWMYKTSPNWYEDYYPANAAMGVAVFDMRGLSRLSRPVLQSFIEFQSDDASPLMVQRTGGEVGKLSGEAGLGGEGFAQHPGFLGNFGPPVSAVPLGDARQGWTANASAMCHGAMLFALARHYRITRDDGWLGSGPGSPLQAMLDAFDWVAFQRARTIDSASGRSPYRGLLPPASAHDWLSGSTIFNDAWCIYGMAELARLLVEIDHPLAVACLRELDGYRRCLRDRYREARDAASPLELSDGRAIPFIPRMVTELDPASVDWTYISYGPLRAGGLGALDPFDSLIEDALAFAETGRSRADGGHERFWSHYVEPETHWPMFELFLNRDDLPRFFELAFNSLAGAVHHDFRVGCEARDGVVSCAPGDAERWRMVRAMFVNERGGYDGSPQTLWLMQAVPESWLRRGCRMEVREMRTCFGGSVSLTIRVDDRSGDVHTAVQLRDLASAPAGIRVRLRSGDGRPLRAAFVNGKEADVLEKNTVALGPAREGAWEVVGRF